MARGSKCELTRHDWLISDCVDPKHEHCDDCDACYDCNDHTNNRVPRRIVEESEQPS